MGRLARWALWPLGIAAEVAAFVFLFGGSGEVGAVEVINRAVGGSFIACGLVTWQRRPDNRTGRLLTLTGFLFLAEPLLIEVDSSVLYTLGQVVANWWTIPFATLILAFPSGRITSRVDRAIIALFVLIEGAWQLLYVLFLPFPPGKTNVLLISADAHAADVIDTWQRWAIVVVGGALVVVGVARWLRAPPPLRRLLLPTLAGSLAVLVLIAWVAYQLLSDELARATQTVTALVLLLVPLAFALGLLRAQFARAGMADLIVALQRAPDSRVLAELLARALRDPSLALVYWLPDREVYADADGHPVELPGPGAARTATPIDDAGRPVAALVHDAALVYEPDLLEVVCAAASVALERERLQAEIAARVVALEGSRQRVVTAGDAERRRLERDLREGAQQRLAAIEAQLRQLKDHVRDDPSTEHLVVTASDELARSLAELRELAQGSHPAALEHGLAAALDVLAARSPVLTAVSYEAPGRFPPSVELAAYFVASEALTNVARYAEATSVTVRVWRAGAVAGIEVADDDGGGGADERAGSGLRGLTDRVEALHGSLRVISPPGAGTVVTAELPCGSR